MLKKLLNTTILLLCTVGLFAKSANENIAPDKVLFIKADSPEIRYTGRVVKSQNGEVTFNWSGTYFETSFTGRYFAMKASDTKKNYYNVFIDDQTPFVVTVSGTDSLVVFAKDLKKGTHKIRVQKRTEGEQGKTTIHSFILSKGARLINPGIERKRRIEFIGNSITAGYGTEGKTKTEPFKPETENCNYAYGCIISRFFDADYTLIAHSGRGAARNYGDTARVSKVSMKDLMLYTYDEDRLKNWDFRDFKWNFKEYRPDLVVINLGSNDFSTKPHPLKEEFLGAYDKIINQIRENYGDVKILCVAPPKGNAFDYLREFCIERKDPNIHFAAYLNGVYNNDSDQGSSGHPNFTGQRKIAMTLIPHISSIMGWEIDQKVVY